MPASKKTESPTPGLDAALAQIEKQFGAGSVMRMGDKSSMRVEAIPTGLLSLDVALGAGGIPRGRIIEAIGPEAGGKSTLAMMVAAQIQRVGGLVAYVDAEHAMSTEMAEGLGVNVDDLLISQPDHGEQALEIVDLLVRSGDVDFIVVDSVAALTPLAEIEGSMGDQHIGRQAKMMAQALRKITANLNQTNTTIFFINQLREKVGFVGHGSNETTPGGRALKFYASVRLDIRRIGAYKRGDDIIGNETRIKVIKNRVGRPFTQCKVDLIYGEGFSNESSLLELGLEYGFVKKSGVYYGSIEGESFGQGKEKARVFLKENPEVAVDLEAKIRDAVWPEEPEDADTETGEIVEESA